MCFPRGEVGEGVAEVVHGIENIFNVNAFGWNIFLYTLLLKDIVLYTHLLALLVRHLNLRSLLQSFPSIKSTEPGSPRRSGGGRVGGGDRNLRLFEKSSPDDLNTGGLHIGICYGEKYNVLFPFFYNLCEPFSLNVQLLCSVITITTCMLSDVCLINFITGCVWNSSDCTCMGSQSSESLWAEY